METEESYHLSHANQKPKNVGAVVWRPEIQRADGVDYSPGVKTWEQENQLQEKIPPQLFQTKRECTLSCYTFLSYSDR